MAGDWRGRMVTSATDVAIVTSCGGGFNPFAHCHRLGCQISQGTDVSVVTEGGDGESISGNRLY
jgi:hypothetical protein